MFSTNGRVGTRSGILLHRRRCKPPIMESANLSVVLFPRDSRLWIFEILERRIHIPFKQQPVRQPTGIANFQRQFAGQLAFRSWH